MATLTEPDWSKLKPLREAAKMHGKAKKFVRDLVE
jgi:hypothetical protein